MEPSGCSVCLSKGASQQEPQHIRGNTLLLQLRGTPCPRAARCSGGKSLPGAPAATTSCPQLSQLIFFFSPFLFVCLEEAFLQCLSEGTVHGPLPSDMPVG